MSQWGEIVASRQHRQLAGYGAACVATLPQALIVPPYVCRIPAQRRRFSEPVSESPSGSYARMWVNVCAGEENAGVSDAARHALDAAGMASNLTTVAAADEDEFARDLFVTRLNFQHPGILPPKEVYMDPLGFPSEHPRCAGSLSLLALRLSSFPDCTASLVSVVPDLAPDATAAEC